MPGEIVSSIVASAMAEAVGCASFMRSAVKPYAFPTDGDGKDRPIPFCAPDKGPAVEGDIAVPRTTA